MAFPGAPVNGQQHTEGSKNYIYDAAGGVWLVEDLSGAGATNLAVGTVDGTTVQVTSSTGTDATIPAATTTTAGVVSAADKVKLDATTNTNSGDQTATTVPFTATGNTTSTNVQDALVEIQTELDANNTDLSIGTVNGTTVEVASSDGTNAVIPAATTTTAGVVSAADKTKLDTVETNAAADQNAAEVPITAITGVAATDVQGALAEHQSDIDALQSVTGNFVGQVATSAALDALVDVDGSAAVENGDIAYLNVDEGGREAGFYLRTGGAWPATPFFQVPDTFVAANAILADNLVGDGGTAITYARSDHRHAQSRGAVLPATDGTGGIEHVLQGHATLPDGKYILIGTVWVQV